MIYLLHSVQGILGSVYPQNLDGNHRPVISATKDVGETCSELGPLGL
jgi:hypothetical protein